MSTRYVTYKEDHVPWLLVFRRLRWTVDKAVEAQKSKDGAVQLPEVQNTVFIII